MERKKAIVLIDPLISTLMVRDAARAQGYAAIAWITLPEALIRSSWQSFMRYALAPQNETGFDWVLKEPDEARALEALADSSYNIVGVIPVSEPAVDFGDSAAQKLGLPGNDARLSLARRDKALMKEAALAAGLRTAQFARCRSEAEIKAFAAQCGFPLVVKTPAGMSTVHVYRVDNMESLLDKFRLILNSVDPVGDMPEFVLVEEFIEGPEYIVNLFGDGETVHVTDIWLYEKNDNHHAAFLYRNTLLLPLDDPALQPLKDYAVALSRAMGVTRGPLHAEIKTNEKGPVMIEIAARYSGLGTPMMLKDFSNFDPFQSNIEVFTKGTVKMPEKIEWRRSIAIATPAIHKKGKVLAIQGLQEIQQLPTYHFHRLMIGEGDEIAPSKNLTEMLFYVWLVGENAADVKRDAERVHDLFDVDVAQDMNLRQAG